LSQRTDVPDTPAFKKHTINAASLALLVVFLAAIIVVAVTV
jgi:hypothetical protein